MIINLLFIIDLANSFKHINSAFFKLSIMINIDLEGLELDFSFTHEMSDFSAFLGFDISLDEL
jgi:hypothetical protein